MEREPQIIGAARISSSSDAMACHSERYTVLSRNDELDFIGALSRLANQTYQINSFILNPANANQIDYFLAHISTKINQEISLIREIGVKNQLVLIAKGLANEDEGIAFPTEYPIPYGDFPEDAERLKKERENKDRFFYVKSERSALNIKPIRFIQITPLERDYAITALYADDTQMDICYIKADEYKADLFHEFRSFYLGSEYVMYL